VACTPIDTVQGGFHAMDHWGGVDEALVIGSAEGYVSATHLSASQLLFEARRRGASTLCLQHGMTLPRRLTFAAGSFGAWDEATAATLRAALPPADAARIAVTGSPKLLDALLPGDDAALAARLGAQVGAFARKVLIGTNLHWDAHRHGSQATYAWIERLLARNPDTLFVLRPHPDDSSVYGRPDLLARPNLVLMDDMALLALDWPVARLVRAVDGVITTYSTLALDALAAGRPLAVLPYRHDQARRPEAFFPASLPLNGAADALPVLSDEDWNAGCLPAALTSPRDGTPQEAGREWFEPSRHCLSRITGLGRGAAAHAVEPTRDAMAEAAFEAARFVSFDRHPHQDRANFTAGLTAFLNEGA
jgi:hypothetical protein